MSLIFVIAWVLSVAFSVLVAAAVVTYIRRTWQQIGADAEGGAHDLLLDGIDRLETRLYMVTERLDGIEQRIARLEAPEAPPRLEAAEGGDASDETEEASR